jgi:hypothetical protein
MNDGWLARLLPDRNMAARLYGTVLVTSILATLDSGEQEAIWMMAAVVVAAMIFAVTHAWAQSLAARADVGTREGRETLLRALRHEWPMVESAGPAAIALLLAVLGVFSTDTALWIAICVNIVLLFVWGAGLKQAAGGTGGWILLSGLWTVTLGVVLVILKLLVH